MIAAKSTPAKPRPPEQARATQWVPYARRIDLSTVPSSMEVIADSWRRA